MVGYSHVDENLEELTHKYVANHERYDDCHSELMVRFSRLGAWRSQFRDRWTDSGPHSNELDAKFKEVLQPVRAALTSWLHIEEERRDNLARLLKASTKVKPSNAKKKLPILEELVQSSVRDLDEGISRRVAILDEYERALQAVELFFDREVPSA
jgi:hypothetical protein